MANWLTVIFGEGVMCVSVLVGRRRIGLWIEADADARRGEDNTPSFVDEQRGDRRVRPCLDRTGHIWLGFSECYVRITNFIDLPSK